MLSRIALASAAALRNPAPLSMGILQASRPFHTGKASLAPVPPLPEKGGKVRYGLIPEEFFQFLYPKTGVTGPYVFGTGLLVYLLSKEIYVINHETIAGACILTVIIYSIKKLGPQVAAFADKLNDDKLAAAQEVKDASMKGLEKAIQEEKKEQWRVEGRHYLFDAKRNTVNMLLEVNFRERLLNVYNEVKKRLDYQVALQHLQRRKEQDHMINWIEKNVVQSITPQQNRLHPIPWSAIFHRSFFFFFYGGLCYAKGEHCQVHW
uniref:ATP synthase subunit b n=1 Tax=Leptobrachium leishanense TaxID=445787 RepID=A0A8C5LYP7_9ANUR